MTRKAENKGKVLRIYQQRAVFENLETGNCLLAQQVKDRVLRGSLRNLQVCQREELPDLGAPEKVIHIEGIFGIYDMFSCSYVALAINSEPYLDCPACSLRLVTKMVVVPLFRNVKLLSEKKQADEDKLLALLESAFRLHNLFMSDKSDITHTQQRVAKLTLGQASGWDPLPLWKRADHRFFWNLVSVLDLIACDATQWITVSLNLNLNPEPGSLGPNLRPKP